jgi:CNT family concentrative nucleoside transporter
MGILRGLIGVVSLLFICYLFSNNKKNIDWRLVAIGMGLQLSLALGLLKVPFVRSIFQFVVDFFVLVISASLEASQFLFGDLAIQGGPYGFAFTVLPTIVFFSALSSLLYYLGILQKVVYLFAWIMRKTMRLSGAESLAAAANIFIGQTEAPLVVKPYLESMTKSEIMSLMVGGMATIAGGVFGAYLSMLGGESPEGIQLFGMHLLTGSIISAPAAIVAAKIIFPESERSLNEDSAVIPKDVAGANFLDALSRGTTDGLKLAVNVGAMLLAFMAVIYLFNDFAFGLGNVIGINDNIVEWTGGRFDGLSLQLILGIVFAPIAWLIGIPSNEIMIVGQMLGEKTILNEFVAYASLMEYTNINSPVYGMLSERSILLCTYALLGFANFASIGIQIGGIGAIAPGQRKTLTMLGVRALIGGTIASLLTASVVCIIL